MATRGKKFRAAVAKVDRTRQYAIPEAVALVSMWPSTWGWTPGTPTKWSGGLWCFPMEPESRFVC